MILVLVSKGRSVYNLKSTGLAHESAVLFYEGGYMKNIFHCYYLVFLSVVTGVLGAGSVQADELNLAVANSTCTAMQEVGKLFEERNNTTINYICKSSGRLAKGLNGSVIKADVYVSANRKWMDYMIDKDLVDFERVSSPWGNKLVVATNKDSHLEISEWTELDSDKVKSILIGDPGTAPFGRYAKQAMQSTGIWERVKKKIKTKKHITLLAETLADSDDDTVGILFASNINDKHKKVFSVDGSWHPPIRYYIAPVKNGDSSKKVTALLDFIQGADAKKIFRENKFKVDDQ